MKKFQEVLLKQLHTEKGGEKMLLLKLASKLAESVVNMTNPSLLAWITTEWKYMNK